MFTVKDLPKHLRPCREKLFGDGRPRPMDRNAKARVMVYARALMRRTEAGKAYGQITAKALAVLEALLGVIAESSQKPTLSQLPLDISVLRKRPFG